jgi:hypothetical protein
LEGSHVGDFRDQPDPVRLLWIDERAYRYPKGSEDLFAHRTGKSVRNSSSASATAVFAATTETQIATGDFVDPNGGKLTCSQWWEQRWPTKAASLRASTRARDEGN